PQFGVVLGCAQDDSARRHASAAILRLVLAPLGIDVPPAQDDGAPLVAMGVLEPGAGATGPLRLTATARLLLSGGEPAPFRPAGRTPPRLAAAVEGLSRYLRSGGRGAIVLRGPV